MVNPDNPCCQEGRGNTRAKKGINQNGCLLQLALLAYKLNEGRRWNLFSFWRDRFIFSSFHSSTSFFSSLHQSELTKERGERKKTVAGIGGGQTDRQLLGNREHFELKLGSLAQENYSSTENVLLYPVDTSLVQPPPEK